VELSIIVMLAFAVWFVIGIIEILVRHFLAPNFQIGLCNTLRIVVLIMIMGMIVAYCGVPT